MCASRCMRSGAVDRRGLVQRHQFGRVALLVTCATCCMRNGEVVRRHRTTDDRRSACRAAAGYRRRRPQRYLGGVVIPPRRSSACDAAWHSVTSSAAVALLETCAISRLETAPPRCGTSDQIDRGNATYRKETAAGASVRDGGRLNRRSAAVYPQGIRELIEEISSGVRRRRPHGSRASLKEAGKFVRLKWLATSRQQKRRLSRGTASPTRY
jgi:hypothetical protein